MARLLGCVYAVALTAVAQQVAPVYLHHVPTAWAYSLAPACYWRPRPWTQILGPDTPPAEPDRAGRRAQWRCLHGRGLKSMVIFSAHIERRWPSATTLAEWETEDAENDNPPPADWKLAPEQP